MIESKVSIRLRKSITYNILYLFTSLMGGCWCSNKNVTNTGVSIEKKEGKNNLVQSFKNDINTKNGKHSINRANNGGADNDRENNSNKNSNNNRQNQFGSIPSNPGQYKPTEVSTKCSKATSSLQINATQNKAFQDNNRNNDTLSKKSLANNDNDKESSEQKKQDLPNNTSDSNDIESLNNSNEETTNTSKNFTTHANAGDGTFLEGDTQKHTSFQSHLLTNPSYKPNDEKDETNKLTTISPDHQNANSIPITNGLKITPPNNSQDQLSPTNQDTSEKKKKPSLVTKMVNGFEEIVNRFEEIKLKNKYSQKV